MPEDTNVETKINILEMNLSTAITSKKSWQHTVKQSEFDLQFNKDQLRLAEITEETFKEAIEKFKNETN